MGVCVSKADKPVESSKPQVTQRSKPERKQSNKRKTVVHKDKGSKLSDGMKDQPNDISPREAAKLAAEKRLKGQIDSLTQGELGKKLAKERAKTYNSYKHED